MKAHFKKNFFFYFTIVLLAISTAFFYLYGEYRLTKVRDLAEDQRQEAQFYASQAVNDASKDPLKLVVQSLSWAVRAELLNENKQELRRYLKTAAEDPAVREVMLCDTANVVRFASDQTWENQPFAQYHPAALLATEYIAVSAAQNGQGFFLAAPVMGLNRRYGTLFLHYNAPKP